VTIDPGSDTPVADDRTVDCSVSTQYGIKGVVDALGKGPESGLIWPALTVLIRVRHHSASEIARHEGPGPVGIRAEVIHRDDRSRF
jgi:hypothetical protein